MKKYLNLQLVIKTLFNDYGQKWDRQSLRKDFNPKLTKKYVPIYNERGMQ
jgi:hypothetical protein